MKSKKLTFREKQLIKRNEMYADYLKSIEQNPSINKSELKRRLAADYGYVSETSVNTVIWQIENKDAKQKELQTEK